MINLTNPIAMIAIGPIMVKTRLITNLKAHKRNKAIHMVARIPTMSPDIWSKVEYSHEFFSDVVALYY